MKLAVTQGFEDYIEEFRFNSVLKRKPQEGFSWRGADPWSCGDAYSSDGPIGEKYTGVGES
jgi:hypothetical protein